MLPELNDHEFILFQPEANVMRRLSHKLDRDIMAVIGTSRNVKMVDQHIERYGPDWKVALLRSQGAEEAANRLETILKDHPMEVESAA
jgi:hypothetical protein